MERNGGVTYVQSSNGMSIEKSMLLFTNEPRIFENP